MKKDNLKKIICSTASIDETVSIIQQEIIKDKIELLKSCIEHPTKPGYKRKDILEKIKVLKLTLKTY